MANVVCTSFKSELIKGDHDFANDTFKIALYTSSATSLADYTAYSAIMKHPVQDIVLVELS